jgi:hypothetical protein
LSLAAPAQGLLEEAVHAVFVRYLGRSLADDDSCVNFSFFATEFLRMTRENCGAISQFLQKGDRSGYLLYFMLFLVLLVT